MTNRVQYQQAFTWLKTICMLMLTLTSHAAVVDTISTASWDIVPGADWNWNLANNALATITVEGTFDHPLGGGSFTTSTTIGTIDKSLGVPDSIGAFVVDTDGSGARADGGISVYGISIGPARITYSYDVTAMATSVPPDHITTSTATLNDPLPLQVGSAGDAITHSQILNAGSKISRRSSGSVATGITLRARFGQGTFDDGSGNPAPSPDVFWETPAPSGAFDLYTITIRENTAGTIEATVIHHVSADPDYAISFAQSEAAEKAAIEAAGWAIGSDGNWELPFDVLLGELTLSAVNSSNAGADAAIGIQTSTVIMAPAVGAIPATSTIGLIMLVCAITAVAAWIVARNAQLGAAA